MVTCGSCGLARRCNFVGDGHSVCAACAPRRSLSCSHCGADRPPSAHWPEGPVCERCYRAGLARRGTCVARGDDRRLVDPPGTGALRCADCAGQTGRGRRCTGCGAEDLTYAEGRCAALRARHPGPSGVLRSHRSVAHGAGRRVRRHRRRPPALQRLELAGALRQRGARCPDLHRCAVAHPRGPRRRRGRERR